MRAPPVNQSPQEHRQSSVNDELKAIFQLMNEQKRKDMDIKTTPEVFITAGSKDQEVQEWLKAKNFPEEICKGLKGKNGREMFKIAQQPNELFNSSEGKRLQSQLKLQMSVCGVSILSCIRCRRYLVNCTIHFQYQTVRISEFKQIMQKAKARVASDYE